MPKLSPELKERLRCYGHEKSLISASELFCKRLLALGRRR